VSGVCPKAATVVDQQCPLEEPLMSQVPLSLLDHFADIPDPRRDHCKLHLLTDILAIALCAVLAGADSWPQIEAFAQEKHAWLARFLKLPNGIPSHDTFRRVFAALRPKAFEDCFIAWMNAACDVTGLQRIHIDGKTLRGSRRHSPAGPGAALHLVSAWAGANHLTLGQVAVAAHSNEITAIPKLLAVLDLKGCIVTIDALGCQKEIAHRIIRDGGDYVLAVKDNQPTLRQDIEAVFATALQTNCAGLKYDLYRTQEQGHGRQETRTYLALFDPPGLSTLDQWRGLRAVVRVTRERTVGGTTSVEHHYYISSARLKQQAWAEVIRGHWGIENNLHWVLDVVFREDANRTQDRNAACNLALVRKIALSLLKRTAGQDSMPTKRLRAALSETYLEKVLSFLAVAKESEEDKAEGEIERGQQPEDGPSPS
jgi:predicted transposase YbfD/YdcC